MDLGAQKILESSTLRTLHAHSFSRSSTQATLVLTDLLGRYLTLLTNLTSKYTVHAGRRNPSIHDVLGALSDMGVSIEELSQYVSNEGKEMNRYAARTSRRVEDLGEFRSQLMEGLSKDRDDATLLQYLANSDSESDSDASEEEEEMDVDVDMDAGVTLSPILRPHPTWSAPGHIPDFLPPFPATTTTTESEDIAMSTIPEVVITNRTPMAPPPLPKSEKPTTTATTTPSVALSSTFASSADILVQVPYSQSSLSQTPEWHLSTLDSLPSLVYPKAPVPPKKEPASTPHTELSLMRAYAHILRTPQLDHPLPLTPSRHKVVMSMVHSSQTTPKYSVSDSLFGVVTPCPPRVGPVGPSFAVALDGGSGGGGKDRLPPMPPRPVVQDSNARMAPLVGQQQSRIPDLARLVLPPAIFARTTRLSHPPVLYRGSKPITYGPGIPAPWNANPIPSDSSSSHPHPPPPTPVSKEPPRESSKDPSSKEKKGEEETSITTRDRDAPPKPVLPDARLYATWDYDMKDFKMPLVPVRSSRGLGRVGSVVGGGSGGGPGTPVGGGGGGGGVISLSSAVGRSKGAK